MTAKYATIADRCQNIGRRLGSEGSKYYAEMYEICNISWADQGVFNHAQG